MFRAFVGVVILLISFQLEAENCDDCPTFNQGKVDHGYAGPSITLWARFHCDQIRRLRDQVQYQQEYIESLQRQIEMLQNEIRYIRKWTFLGEPAFEVEQE